MTVTWTLLIIKALSGPADGLITGKIAYPGMEACLAAIPHVSASLPYDHGIECVETSVISASAPMRRPTN